MISDNCIRAEYQNRIKLDIDRAARIENCMAHLDRDCGKLTEQGFANVRKSYYEVKPGGATASIQCFFFLSKTPQAIETVHAEIVQHCQEPWAQRARSSYGNALI